MPSVTAAVTPRRVMRSAFTSLPLRRWARFYDFLTAHCSPSMTFLLPFCDSSPDGTSGCPCRTPTRGSHRGLKAAGWKRHLRAFHPHARAKKLPRAAECLVYSLTPSGVLAENHPKNRGFVGILRGQKCLK